MEKKKDIRRFVGVPTTNLLAKFQNTTDTVSLSVSDYDNIGSIWKSTFFSDPTTPLTVDVADILAHAQINKANVIGSVDKGIAIYNADTDLSVINMARSFIGVDVSWCTDVPQGEADALVRLYNMLNGVNWTDDTNWLTDNAVDNWYGVAVTFGHVTTLDLGGETTTLSGDISVVSPLTSLTNLLLDNTSVSGDISVFSPLTSLEYLRLDNTSVSGDISAVSPLTSLTYLWLSDTSISGNISAVSPLTSLTSLRLYNTSVSDYTQGTLPTWTGNNIQIQSLGLTQQEVDDFLCDLATAGGTGGSLDISGTNAAPSATGLACKDTLVTNSWTVTVTV